MPRCLLMLGLLFGASLHAQTLSVSQTAAHACSVHAGAVRCWGTQPNGGLGNVLDEANKQVEVTGISNAIAVGVGNSHSCALISGGTMRCWGRGSEGQLGNGANPVVQRTPVNVTGLAGAVSAIAVADFTTCAQISGGSVQCFGFDGSGELGNDAALTASNVPVTVAGISTAQEISAGSRHFCVRLGDATARCWGSNSAGQLGDNSIPSRSTPVAVSGLSGNSAISAAQFHTCATTVSGTKCWGNNIFGQLGTSDFTPSATPVAVSAVNGAITRLSAGGRHTCAQTSTTTITCFGRNFDGQLSQSNNSGFSPNGLVMQGLPGLAITDLSTGTASTCVRFAEEDIRCVGSGSFGQLGDGIVRRWKSPVPASYDPSAKLSLGAQRTCSKIGSGQPQYLGFNGFGGLGDGSTERRLSLVTVSGSSPSANSVLTSSESQTCLFNNGLNALFTRCWGRNDTRQLGLSTNGDQLSAVQAPEFTDARLIAEISFGTFFGCAIFVDIDPGIPKTVRCWGSNAQGQLGDGTTVDKFANQSIDIIGLNDPRQGRSQI